MEWKRIKQRQYYHIRYIDIKIYRLGHVRGVIKKYAEKCYKILNFYSIKTKFDTYKVYLVGN